jgi:hypothetical protein
VKCEHGDLRLPCPYLRCPAGVVGSRLIVPFLDGQEIKQKTYARLHVVGRGWEYWMWVEVCADEVDWSEH